MVRGYSLAPRIVKLSLSSVILILQWWEMVQEGVKQMECGQETSQDVLVRFTKSEHTNTHTHTHSTKNILELGVLCSINIVLTYGWLSCTTVCTFCWPCSWELLLSLAHCSVCLTFPNMIHTPVNLHYMHPSLIYIYNS